MTSALLIIGARPKQNVKVCKTLLIRIFFVLFLFIGVFFYKKECTCSQGGVEISQCDRNDGHCLCRPGVTGYYCDTCARDTFGRAPHCQKCGECFDSWDQIIVKLNCKS